MKRFLVVLVLFSATVGCGHPLGAALKVNPSGTPALSVGYLGQGELVFGGPRGTVTVFNPALSLKRVVTPSPCEKLLSIAYCDQEGILACGCTMGSIALYQRQADHTPALIDRLTGESPVNSLSFMKNGNVLLAATGGALEQREIDEQVRFRVCEVKVISLKDHNVVRHIPASYPVFAIDTYNDDIFAFSTSNGLVETVTLSMSDEPTVLNTVDSGLGAIHHMAFLSLQRILCVCDGRGLVDLNLVNNISRTISVDYRGTYRILCLSVDRQDNLVFCGTSTGQVICYSLDPAPRLVWQRRISENAIISVKSEASICIASDGGGTEFALRAK